ncbi:MULTISPECIES: hypothetical protein [Methylobacterium]|uniref:hypothetical protein n=1 Tax=Methylobacterium TaxID=407 RepID=UPI00272EC2E3|nr:hypothetical protein [Methylobacterium sp.]
MDAAVRTLISPYLLGSVIALAIGGQIIGAIRSGVPGVWWFWRASLFAIAGLGLLTVAIKDVQMLLGGGAANTRDAEFMSRVLSNALALWAGYSLWVLTVSAWIIAAISYLLARPKDPTASVSDSEISRPS